MSDHRLATDRVDGTIVAECPNKEYPDDDHLTVAVEYEEAAINTLVEEFIDAFETCGECGADLDYVAEERPSEVLE